MARTPKKKNFITGPLRLALLAARDRILEEPLRLDMTTFVGNRNDEFDQELPACGTVGCIAGWAHLSSFRVSELAAMSPSRRRSLNGGAANWFRREVAKQKSVIALEDEDGRDLDTLLEGLYSTTEWPEPYAERYAAAGSPKQRARVTARRIEHFIQTGE